MTSQIHVNRPHDRSFLVAAIVAGAIGVGAAALYFLQDLTLSHYDAKAHLVVARRIVDSMRPGWKQIGAVWLPLPHLLNVVPVQFDPFYRTGLSAVAFSVAGFVTAAVSLWWIVARSTGSPIAAWAAFTVLAAHPDVLYLQATPMTESLLMGFCLLGTAFTWKWVMSAGASRVWPAGLTLALACLTRYEAWPIAAAAVGLAAVALVRLGVPSARACARAAALGSFPAVAVSAFLVLSRTTVGSWLVTGGFFEVDHATYHKPLVVGEAIWAGLRVVNGELTTMVGTMALVLLIVTIVRTRQSAHLLIVLALLACIALPLYAFWQGHPFRIRYMVPLTMALAAITGVAVGLLGRCRTLAAGLVIALAILETPPLSGRSPMVIEAQRDAENARGRQRVTQCLTESYDQTPILASMASLAHYMQETAWIGLSIRQYIHEGIGQLWADSLAEAGRHASWILVDEEGEGGDALARLSRASDEFLAGFERVCEGGGVALYRRGMWRGDM
ncbi:MAG TPA: hypothetical protein VD833_17050 [Vicinamibacterales bacterium]|nr:hypothetical protein [Vicinamibacterales bacterium]